jgi:hypothetical protein
MSTDAVVESSPVEHFDIHIDRKPYVVSQPELSGAALRQLAGLPGSVDLYLEEQGDVEDELIKDHDVVRLRPGMHFYSTPSNITPGRG